MNLQPLQNIMNKIITSGEIPETCKTACITLIPKEGQDTTLTKYYRPISLLNNDYKLFTEILVGRPKKVIQEFIHEDQSGFLPKRQIRDNVRTVLNVVEYLDKHPEKQAALIFLDAEKAFDNLNWNFLFRTLEELDFGENFLKWGKSIYTSQKAQIIINGEVSKPCEIQRGTRQGCPLSPLLFILVLELLNQGIRQDE